MLTRIFVVLLLLVPAHALALRVDEVPNPRATHGGWVTDPSGVLGAVAPEIEARFALLERETGQEVALVVLPSIGDAVPRAFATALFNYWGVGKKGRDNGVLVLQVLDQRRIEIEPGYTSESALPDVKCAWLLREVAHPFFRAGDLARGHAVLSRGIDFALRNPEATHAQLIAAAQSNTRKARALPAAVEPRTSIAWSWFLLALCAAIAAQWWRVRAHGQYHRTHADSFSVPWGGWLFGLLFGSFFLIVDCQVDRTVPPLVLLGLTTFWVAARAVQVQLAARRRYRRTCPLCGEPMSLLTEEALDAALSAGQRSELGVHSVVYDAWRCHCGASSIDAWPGADPHPLCALCGFHTELSPNTTVLQEATASATGIEQQRYDCAHCHQQRLVQRVIPMYVASSSSDDSSSSSSSDSSSSSSESFGGGSSGGGGAGDSY